MNTLKARSQYLKDPFLKQNRCIKGAVTEVSAVSTGPLLKKVLGVGISNMIRGQIVSDGGYCTKKETTDFRGDHMVECYVIKNEVVVARAQIEVPIS
ncbi:hypothetical protein MWK86_12820 [Escherichia coli]|nr:hypothetical protein [Escherichia coli]